MTSQTPFLGLSHKAENACPSFDDMLLKGEAKGTFPTK